MSRYIVKAMYLENSKFFVIRNGEYLQNLN